VKNLEQELGVVFPGLGGQRALLLEHRSECEGDGRQNGQGVTHLYPRFWGQALTVEFTVEEKKPN
jgi:hypothetical protein